MITGSYFVNYLCKEMSAKNLQHTLWVFISILTIIRFFQYVFKLYRQIATLPPGPWGFPIVGYLTFMGHEKHTRFMELAKKYGSIFSARLGNQLTVVMSDYKMIRECFRRDEFTGRPDTPFMQTLNGFGKLYFLSNWFG